MKIRYAACLGCRDEAKRKVGCTDGELYGLKQGRKKGKNNRLGFKQREETKQRISLSLKNFAVQNPEKKKIIGTKIRGVLHYNWKGGQSRLNTSIRQMHENRQWMNR